MSFNIWKHFFLFKTCKAQNSLILIRTKIHEVCYTSIFFWIVVPPSCNRGTTSKYLATKNGNYRNRKNYFAISKRKIYLRVLSTFSSGVASVKIFWNSKNVRYRGKIRALYSQKLVWNCFLLICVDMFCFYML